MRFNLKATLSCHFLCWLIIQSCSVISIQRNSQAGNFNNASQGRWTVDVIVVQDQPLQFIEGLFNKQLRYNHWISRFPVRICRSTAGGVYYDCWHQHIPHQHTSEWQLHPGLLWLMCQQLTHPATSAFSVRRPYFGENLHLSTATMTT